MNSFWRNRYVLICIGVLVSAFLAWVFVVRPLITPSSFTVNVNRTSVIKQIRSLARLETAAFTIEKIIDAQTNDTNAIQRFLFGDKILLVAHGQVIAGFDLSQLSEKDISITDKSITLKLPAPQILVSSLDNSKTRVYDRQQGIFRKNDVDLEAAARAEAEKSIRAAACEADILETAATNARRQLSAFLQGLGFETVTIQIAHGECS